MEDYTNMKNYSNLIDTPIDKKNTYMLLTNPEYDSEGNLVKPARYLDDEQILVKKHSSVFESLLSLDKEKFAKMIASLTDDEIKELKEMLKESLSKKETEQSSRLHK